MDLLVSLETAPLACTPLSTTPSRPPTGTGKTMVAKRLAQMSGMDYAIMSGGDVGPLGRSAVTELHRLFEWARTSPRGLLLFIDESDAFLASRSRAGMSEDQRNALNALLFQTGEASQHCMLVLASNRPGDLDAAVSDRVDEALSFGLPDVAERTRLVSLHLDRYVVRAGEGARWGPWGLFARAASRIAVAPGVLDPGYHADIARRTEGFSGRELAKLFIAAQGAVYGGGGGAGPLVLDRALLEEVLAWKLREHAAKRSGFGGADWTAAAASAPAAPPPVAQVFDADFADHAAPPPPAAPLPAAAEGLTQAATAKPASHAAAANVTAPAEAASESPRATPSAAGYTASGAACTPRAGAGASLQATPLAVPVGGAAAGLTDI